MLVLISYNWGFFSIMQTDGKDTRKPAGTRFDLSAGFRAWLEYKDGYGSTDEYDGGSWEGQKVTVGHDVLGITDEFERGAEAYDTPPASVGNTWEAAGTHLCHVCLQPQPAMRAGGSCRTGKSKRPFCRGT